MLRQFSHNIPVFPHTCRETEANHFPINQSPRKESGGGGGHCFSLPPIHLAECHFLFSGGGGMPPNAFPHKDETPEKIRKKWSKEEEVTIS